MTSPIKEECCRQCLYAQLRPIEDTCRNSLCLCHKGQEIDANERMGELHDEIEPPKSESWEEDLRLKVQFDSNQDREVCILFIHAQKQASYEEGRELTYHIAYERGRLDETKRHEGIFEAGKREGMKEARELILAGYEKGVDIQIPFKYLDEEQKATIEAALLDTTPHHDKS